MANHQKGEFRFMSGDEALALGAYEAGLKVAASYPGTPASEILETLACFPEVAAQWSVNEKVAFEVACAASIGGARSLYSSKHVGLNVAMDPLMTASYVGVNAGFIVVTADDPGIHSSQNEQDNRLVARFAKVPLLEPSSPSEAKAFAPVAFELSEAFDTPVLVRLTTRVAHTKENVARGARVEAAPKPFKIDAAKYVMVPKNAMARHVFVEARLERLRAAAESSPLNRVEKGRKDLGIIAAGVPYLYAKEAYPDASFLKLGFPYPFPVALIRAFAKSVRKLVVVEELEPFLEEELARLGIRFSAKHPSFRVGELRPELMERVVRGEPRPAEEAATRKPVMCPGCPHRNTFWVLKKLKAVVAGDIGCYTLGALAPIGSLHTCVCMGAGVTFLEGFKKAGLERVVGVIGDSTFVHSGITGLINLVYNRTHGVLIILDNSTTAMTGNQPHPATGRTLQGMPTHKLSLEDVCRSTGADHVDVVDPMKVKDLESLIKERLEEPALSVIIARFPCRLLDRAKNPRPVYEKELCRKCGLCLEINCPALTATDEKLIAINKTVCTGCYLCVSVCPFGALKRPA